MGVVDAGGAGERLVGEPLLLPDDLLDRRSQCCGIKHSGFTFQGRLLMMGAMTGTRGVPWARAMACGGIRRQEAILTQWRQCSRKLAGCKLTPISPAKWRPPCAVTNDQILGRDHR